MSQALFGQAAEICTAEGLAQSVGELLMEQSSIWTLPRG